MNRFFFTTSIERNSSTRNFAFLRSFEGFSTIVGGLTGLGVSVRVCSSYFDALFNRTIERFTKTSIADWPNATKPFASSPDLLALIITVFLSFALLSGLKNSKFLTNFLTIFTLSSLIFFSFSGFYLGRVENYRPFNPFGIEKIFQGTSLLLYSYIGFEMATIAIEEAKNPSTNVPKATVISLILVVIVYSLAGASLTFLIRSKDIDTESAFAQAFENSAWPWASRCISVSIVLTATGNLLSGAYGTIRMM